MALIRFLTPPLPHLLSKSVPYLVAFASALACSSNGAIDVKLLFRVDKGGLQRGLLSLDGDVKMLLDRELDELPEPLNYLLLFYFPPFSLQIDF